jgi:hypothetical protein
MMNTKPKLDPNIKTNPFDHHQLKEKEWKDASKDVFVVPPHPQR